MKLFELAIGANRRYIVANDRDHAYSIGTDPVQHPDISFLPFTITEISVPGFDVRIGGNDAHQVTTDATNGAEPISSEGIARICHEVNRAYCRSIGDDSQPQWEEAPQWQQDSAINGVQFHLENETTPEQSHENWMREKVESGWVYGPVKDPEKKEHPCLVPYDQLPIEQRTKDYLFKAVVDSFKGTALNALPGPDDKESGNEVDFDTMEAPELKAWLNERQVEYVKQWGVVKLREAAKAWLAKQEGTEKQ